MCNKLYNVFYVKKNPIHICNENDWLMQNNIKELYGVISFLLMYEKETGSLYITKQLVYSNKNRSVLAISYTIHISSLSFSPLQHV